MSSVWGNNIRVTIFGESHGRAVGTVIDGLPSGIELDENEIQKELDRRKSKNNHLTTARHEEDKFNIVSGVFKGRTTGTPLCVYFENKDTREEDYDELKIKMRPGHSDFPGFVKYKGFEDFRGGGHFSGRLTVGLVFAGAIAKQILIKNKIKIVSHIKRIGPFEDKSFDYINVQHEIADQDFPLLNSNLKDKMKNLILECSENGDSIGGIIEGAVLNLPVGLGEPFFDSVESVMSHLFFSIPSVKGVEFGSGFEFGSMKGSLAKDEYYYDDDWVKTYENHNGGILGGLTTGMPIIFRTAIKPASSIGISQRTVNVRERKNTELKVEGRHDPCILIRALPVLEAAAALAILELFMER